MTSWNICIYVLRIIILKELVQNLKKKENIWLDTYMKHESTNKKNAKKKTLGY